MIKKTKAKYISAECSACRVQITDSLKDDKVIFRHPLELIAKSLSIIKKQTAGDFIEK